MQHEVVVTITIRSAEIIASEIGALRALALTADADPVKCGEMSLRILCNALRAARREVDPIHRRLEL